MSVFPAVFVSHGSPNLSLQPSPARTFLSQLGEQLGKPKAILIISAHWGTKQPMVSSQEKPDIIHDFQGFSPELNSLNYPALGSPQLAHKVNRLLFQAGIESGISKNRGFPMKIIIFSTPR